MSRFIEASKNMERLQSEDIANAILYTIQTPIHVNVNEILLRPTTQGEMIMQTLILPFYDMLFHNERYGLASLPISSFYLKQVKSTIDIHLLQLQS